MILDAQPDIEIAGEADNGHSAVELALTRRLLRGAAPPPRVLVLTTFDLDEYVYEALHAGASGFLLKSARPAELVAAVRGAVAGDTLLAPAVTRRLVEAFVRRPPPGGRATPALASLTPREREVFHHIAAGRSNAEIARVLHVTDETVKT